MKSLAWMIGVGMCAVAMSAGAGALEECMIRGDHAAVGKCLLDAEREAQDALIKAEGDAGKKARNLDRVYNAAVHGRTVVPETWLLSVVAILTTKTFGRVVANLGWTNTVMHAQAVAGDTITAESEILGKRASNSRPDQGIMHVATRGFNQGGTLLCSYERRFLVYRGEGGPYRKAGY